MKKKITLLLSLCLITATFAACQQPTTGTPAVAQQADDSMPFAGTNVVILRHSGYDADWMRSRFPSFAERTGINVEMEEVAFSLLHDQIALDLASGGGSYDIIMATDAWLTGFGHGGWLADLNQFIGQPHLHDPDFNIDHIPQSMMVATAYGDKQVALPFRFNSIILMYRTDLISTPPTTYQEVLAIAREHAGSDVRGIGLTLSRTAIIDLYGSIITAFGGQLLADDLSRSMLDTPQALEALEFLIELYSYGIEGGLARHWDETAVFLAQGQTMMDLLINTQAPFLLDPERSHFPDNIGFAPLPMHTQHGSMASVWSFAIPAGSRNQEAAFMFLQYLLAEERILDMVETLHGGMAPAHYALGDANFVEQFPLFDTMNKTVDFANVAPKSPQWTTVSDHLAIYLQEAVVGRMSAQEALERAGVEMDAILAGS